MSNIWENTKTVQEIKETFAKGLSDAEFATFKQIATTTNLNPFLKEIWAIKSYNRPAQIFIGRDGYRKGAQFSTEYEYHFSDAVYSNDSFSIVNKEVQHTYNLKDRGEIVGAYCTVKRKSSSIPQFLFVEFSEYYQGNKDENGKIKVNAQGQQMKPTLWDSKKATMIKKVAEAQGLRMAFQNVFAGTYAEEEFKIETTQETTSKPPFKTTQETTSKPPLKTIDEAIEEIKQVNNVDPYDKMIMSLIRKFYTDFQMKNSHSDLSFETFTEMALTKYYNKTDLNKLTPAEKKDLLQILVTENNKKNNF
jgi:phage recombination protein Bet